MSVTILDHALIQHKLTIMRDKNTSTYIFKQNLDEIAKLMAFEVTRHVSLCYAGKRNGSTNYFSTNFTCRNWFG